MTTNNLQAELPGIEAQRRVPIPLDLRTLYGKTTYHAALRYVVQCGNFEYDKELYRQLRIDAGNWTRIINGDAALPYEKERKLQELCGNNGLLLWRAYQEGKGVHDLEDAKDRIIREQREENEKLRSEVETLYRVIDRGKS